jgi:hypothetical protein
VRGVNGTIGVALVKPILATLALERHVRDRPVAAARISTRSETFPEDAMSGAHPNLDLSNGMVANKHRRFGSISGMIAASN